jgi:hypothetical protein
MTAIGRNSTVELVSRLLAGRTADDRDRLIAEFLARSPDLAPSSGPLLPPRRRRQAHDFVLGYLTPEDLGLARVSIGEIDKLLSGVTLVDALTLLGRMADHADRALGSPEEETELVRTYLPPEQAHRAVTKIQEMPGAVLSAQLPLLLARQATQVCPADTAGATWDPHSSLLTCWALGILAVAIGDAATSALTDEDLALDLARAQHFFRVVHDLEYEDAYDVLFVSLPTVDCPVDLDEVVLAHYGVSFRTLWAVTAVMSHAYLKAPEQARKLLDLMRPEVKQAWLDLWSVTPQEAAKAWAGDDASAAPWDLSGFFKRPLIDFGAAGQFANVYLPIRSQFLAEKALINEALWIVADLLATPERKALLTAAGKAFERTAVRRVCEYVCDSRRFLTEGQLKELVGEAGGLCDLVVLYPDEWVAFEFVRHSLSKPALTKGDYASLMRDLQMGAVGELCQIDATVSKMLKAEVFQSPHRILPVVVVGGHLSINLLTHAAVMAGFSQRQPQVLTVDSRCYPPAFLDLGDLRLAMMAAEQLHSTLSDVLCEYLDSDLSTMPFTFWLKDAHPDVKPLRSPGDPLPEWLGKAKQWLFEDPCSEDVREVGSSPVT